MPEGIHAMHTGTVPDSIPPVGVDWPNDDYVPPKHFATRGQRAKHMEYLREAVTSHLRSAESVPSDPLVEPVSQESVGRARAATAAQEEYLREKWCREALEAIGQVCALGKDFTTAEDVWPLLDWPGDGRIMDRPVREALKAGMMTRIGTRYLGGVYHSRDGHAFKQNKHASLYRPAGRAS
jgi:hypothetical protein